MRANAVPRNRSAVPARLAAVLIVALVPAACSDAGDDRQRTAEALACLSYGDEGRVADAAVLSGLASPGTAAGTVRVGENDLTPEQWRRSQPTPFASACAVVVAADQLKAAGPPAASSGGSVWTVLWPLLFGAVLTLVTTFLTTGWRERMTIARRHSTALSVAASAYNSAIGEFMAVATDPLQPEPLGTGLVEPRRKLMQVLDEFPPTPDIPQLSGLRQLVGGGALGRDLASGWVGRETRSKSSPAALAVQDGRNRLMETVHTITVAQDRPLRTAAGRLARRVWRVREAGR